MDLLPIARHVLIAFSWISSAPGVFFYLLDHILASNLPQVPLQYVEFDKYTPRPWTATTLLQVPKFYRTCVLKQGLVSVF